MRRYTRYRLLMLLILAALGANSAARNEDGTLGLLQTPNNGVPAVVQTGDVFEVVAGAEATLSLAGAAGIFPMEASWSVHPDGLYRGQCVVDTSLPPGTYALHAEAASEKDVNLRAVYVIDAFPETYHIAHLTDTHIGSMRHPKPSVEIMAELIETVNTSEAAFVLITGDLTQDGTPEQFSQFLELLDMFRPPTWVVPGNHDRRDRNYEQFFGPMTYVFSFGMDGYLGFDTKDFLIADAMGPQVGLLHRFRRQIRGARWSIGFTHRYDVTMGMRAQLTLFVDDPLDYLIYGHYHREAGEQDGIPWGRTGVIMTPAAINGDLRFIQVDTKGVHAGETLNAAAIEIEGE